MKDVKFIDFRLRPPIQGFKRLWPRDNLEQVDRYLRVGNTPVSFFNASVPKLITEMDEAGISMGVVPGRSITTRNIPNDDVAQLQRDYPARFIGFGSIDPTGTLHNPLDEIDRCIKQLGLKGIWMDQCWVVGTHARHIGYYTDDCELYPIYERCAQLGVPVNLMSGPMGDADFTHAHPGRIARVATDFPNLKIIICHGCYPNIHAAFAAIYRCPNIFISPDLYMFMPGAAALYVEAINSDAFGDQIIFATAYPGSSSLKVYVERTLKLGIREEALERYAYKNAARLLGLDA